MKKILSFILVLAMVMSMSVVAVFAEGEATALSISADYTNIIIGKKATITATTTPSEVASTTAWESGTTTVATVSASTGASIEVTGVAEGTSTIKASHTSIDKTCTISVYDGTKYTLTPVKTDYSFKKGASSASVSATVGYTGTYTTGATSAATVTYGKKSGNIAVSTSGVITTTTAGTGVVTATAKVGDQVVKSVDINVTVYDLELSYDVDNYDDRTIALSTLKSDIASEIYSATGDSVTISTVSISNRTTSLGELDLTVADEIKFTAAKGALGPVTYEFTANDGTHTYSGSLTFDIQSYEDIDEEVSGKFSHNGFYIYNPSGYDYMKVVNSESALDGYHSLTSGTWYDDDDDLYLYTPSGTASTDTIYVVAFDGNYISAGTIKIEDIDYDIKYLATEDEETSFNAKDFEDLYEDIFDETNTSSSAYVEFADATFTYTSSNKNYTLYNDGSEMTTSTLKKVDADDLDDVSVKPLKSGEFFITVSLSGKRYSSTSDKTGTTKSYTVVVKVSAVSGDVKYTVAPNSYVALDAADFQEFVEDELTSKALLNYIVIDDSDLSTTKEGTFKALSGTKYAVLDEGEKLYYSTEKSSQYEIDDVRFVSVKNIAKGTEIYVPFTAYGSKTGTEGAKAELCKGYIQFTVKADENPFTDLTADWYKDAVIWAYNHDPQITKGTNAAGTLFSPNQGCTRAQAVTFLYRAAGCPPVTTAEKAAVANFKDVSSTKHSAYIDAIAWAKANGITSGTSASTFAPDKTCTRAQIVTFIYNYAKAAGKSTTTLYANKFTDVKPTGAHKSYANAIQWAYEKNITSGTNTAGTLFSPDATCTRGHIVTFLYNYFK